MSLDATDKIKTTLTGLNFGGDYMYFDTMRDIKSSEITKKKFKIFWFEKCSEFFKS